MRKLLILSIACLMALCAMAQIDAIKVTQGETTDWYPFGESSRIDVTITNGNIVFPNKTYDLAQGNVTTSFGTAPEDTWFTVRKDVTSGNWNTICLEKNITAIDGATFWNVVAERPTEFELEQVSEPQAGYGYIIRYTATELKVQYGNETADAPITATEQHPIQGTFMAIECEDNGTNELVGNYVVYQNQLCKVTGWVTMADHRAYVIPNIAPKKAPAPTSAPRMTMPKPNSTPTEFSTLPYEGKARKGSFKVIENGQFRIVRDNKMYTIMGVEE